MEFDSTFWVAISFVIFWSSNLFQDPKKNK